MNCCKNDKGQFPHNQNIDLGVVIPATETWYLEFTGINGTKFEVSVPYTMGDNLIIPKGLLNEDMYYCVKAYYWDEEARVPEKVYLTEGVEECDNFCFKTYILTNKDCGNTCPPPEEIPIP